MVIKKPSIFIYEYEADRELLKEVCAGMEEEGVFVEIFSTKSGTVDEKAWRAANDSMLGTGIGMNRDRIALQMKGLSIGRHVEAYDCPTAEQCRKIGANSARSIKKMAFK